MSRPRIAIVDYGLGNLFNMARAITYLDAVPTITEDPEEVRRSDKIVLPGVGAFAVGMENLRKSCAAAAIRESHKRGKDVLGICLGMQLLMTSSEEDGLHEGLDLVPGRVERLNVDPGVERNKVPQIGWNTIRPRRGQGLGLWNQTILDGLGEDSFMYFVHSYCVQTDREQDTLAVTTYGGDVFSSVVKKENVVGCQFHPERSADNGIHLLRNFLES